MRTGRIGLGALLCLSAQVMISGCSEDATSARGRPDAAAGGSVQSGDSGNGGSSNGGSTSSAPPSRRAACRAYIQAACQRIAECHGPGALDACLSRVDQCPDYVFSDGSVRTPVAVLACAAEWKTLPCGKAATGVSPPCALPGTRRPGDSCLFPTQCASLNCSGTRMRTCGVCLALAAPGQPCNDTDVGCPLGQTCSGTCEDTEWVPPVAVDAQARPGPGETCLGYEGCTDGYECLRDATDNSILTCRKLPQPGENCALNSGFSRVCAADAYCPAAPAPACVAEPVAGEPCRIGGANFRCKEGHLCVARADAGSGRVCVAEHGEGEPCGTPYVTCVEGTACRSGRCVATDELSLFEKACGG